MTIRQSLKQFVIAGFDVKEDIYLLRKLVLINTLLLMIILLFVVFTVYNVANGIYLTAALDAIALGICGYAYFQLRRHHKLELAINVVVVALLLFLNALAAVGQNESYTLIWTIFYPIFVILLKGRDKGLRLIGLYYAILIPQAFLGIGVWQNGDWDFSSFLRFSIASLVVVYSAYFNEFSFERSYNELTKLKQREIELARQEVELNAQMIERKNQLLADISHELRTPLAVFKINLEALEDGIYDKQQDVYQLLHNHLNDMNRLIADLNHMAAADIGSLTMEHEPVAIASLLDDTIKSYQAMAAEQGIELSIDNQIPDHVMIEGDRDRLVQVFANLMSNSFHYTDHPGRLHIEARYEGQQAIIRFSDSAPGVSKDELPKLFERLYRVELSRSRATGGSGLGLAICKTIIEAHHGSISASSSNLGGITLTIELPVQ